ncbi:MAG TPA: flagellar hook-associated protein FlgL, partial [Phycisphaerae bacterium]|nr:flagellar hook-associated protein FlgL [Phycisphaerae bacterium]
MAINTINFSRVSNNLQTLSVLDSLRRNTMALFAEQNRMASGNRLNAPSEDPVAASRALNLSELLERQDQILANVRHADAFLTATDNGMSEVSDLLTQAKTIASSMVGSVVLADERASQAEIISSIIDQLISVGNRTYNGVYLYGGKSTTSPPFARQYGGVAYLGDTTDLGTDIGGPENAVINLTGDTLFRM